MRVKKGETGMKRSLMIMLGLFLMFGNTPALAEQEEPSDAETISSAEEIAEESSGELQEVQEPAEEQETEEGEGLTDAPQLEAEDAIEGSEQNAVLQAGAPLKIEYHSQMEIAEFIRSHPVQFLDAAYEVEPSEQQVTAGKLTAAVQQDALNAVNQFRYIAGLSHDVVIDPQQAEMAQAASFVNHANKTLSHDPIRPDGWGREFDTIYELGKKGASSSNIAYGFGTLARAVFRGWMGDNDASNIQRVGHRRWVLNPYMNTTGFGHTGIYMAMYSFGQEEHRYDSEAKNVSVWPAPNTPMGYFDNRDPWSFSTGKDETGDVRVVLKRENTGETWNFSAAGSDGFFTVNNNGYAIHGCVIFRPDGVQYQAGDEFSVSITGLVGGDVSYTVKFFDLNSPEVTAEEVIVTPSSAEIYTGELLQLKKTVKPEQADQSVVWSSDNPAAASVDQNGLVTAAGEGTAVITAKSVNGHRSASCTVTVKELPDGVISMSRMYNPNSGEHFYTGNGKERSNLMQVGWVYEGRGFFAPKTSGTPMYRLYNPNAGDHHYTSNQKERTELVNAGWKYEGVGWFADDAKGVAMYRLYNPNAMKAGSHHYTKSEQEKASLIAAGWKDEGIGFYSSSAR